MTALHQPSNEGPIEVMVRMADIKVLPEMFQTRDGLNMKIVSLYSKRMLTGAFPPVLVYRLPDGRMVLADGFHRHAASKSLRRDKIKAIVREGTVEEAILAGLKANQDIVDERALTAMDKSHSIKVMIRNPELNSWSDNGIGKAVSSTERTVKQIRLQLETEESIPLPLRVKVISDGVWTGRWSPYKMKKNGRPAILLHKSSFITSIDGQRTNLAPKSSGLRAAEDKLDMIIASRAATTSQLRSPAQFRLFLQARCIFSRLIESQVGGIVVDNAAVAATDGTDTDAFSRVAFRALLGRAASGASRAIVVGYFRSEYFASGVANQAAELLNLETMTPEEFVAEFAPKEGADTPPTSDA